LIPASLNFIVLQGFVIPLDPFLFNSPEADQAQWRQHFLASQQLFNDFQQALGSEIELRSIRETQNANGGERYLELSLAFGATESLNFVGCEDNNTTAVLESVHQRALGGAPLMLRHNSLRVPASVNKLIVRHTNNCVLL